MSLEEVNKFVGVLVALIGSIVVAPGALQHLWRERLAPWGLRVKERVRVFLARFIPALRKHDSKFLSDTVGMTDAMTTSVTKSAPTAWQTGSNESMVVQLQSESTYSLNN